MDPDLIEKVTQSPSLGWVFAAMGVLIPNAFLGTYMAFFKRPPLLIKTHALLYGVIVIALITFLVRNHIHYGNTVWEYLVFAYFITLVPFSKRWDVLLHALVCIVGLLLLPVLVLLKMF